MFGVLMLLLSPESAPVFGLPELYDDGRRGLPSPRYRNAVRRILRGVFGVLLARDHSLNLSDQLHFTYLNIFR